MQRRSRGGNGRMSMAYFRRRNGKWRAEVTKQGFQRVSKTFILKENAERWARIIEIQMESAAFEDIRATNNIFLKDLLIKYRDKVAIHHKADSTKYKINFLLRHKISELRMNEIKSSNLYELKDELKLTKATKTVNVYIQLLKSVWNTAKRVWSVPLPSSSPFDLVKLDKVKNQRDQVLSKEEYIRLLDCAAQSKLIILKDLIQLAYQTAARYNEIASLKRCDTDLKKQLATFKDTKNGEDRTIPLSNDSVKILKKYPFGEKFFNITYGSFQFYWNQCRSKAGLNHFRFHDLRACAITNMLLRGMNLAEVASISGHKSWSMLKRYTRIKPESLIAKINSIII